MTLSDLCPPVRVCLHLVRAPRRAACRRGQGGNPPMGLAIAKLLFLSPAAATNAAAAGAGWMYAFQWRPSCRSPSAGGRRLASEFGHTTMHAHLPSADRATVRALLLSRLPACLGPPVIVKGRYANVHVGLRFLFLLSIFVISSSFDLTYNSGSSDCPLDELGGYFCCDHTSICFTFVRQTGH